MNASTDAVRRVCFGCCIVLACLTGLSRAEELETESPAASRLSRLGNRISLRGPSLDSVIRWTDQYFFHQWRIQQHVVSQECRLLDEDGEQRAQGTYQECLASLESIRREQNLQPMRGKGVVLLHGLAVPCWSMKLLARHLRKHGGFEVFPVDYASLRSDIDYQAVSLARIIAQPRGY